MFNFIRSFQSIFQSGCTTLHYHQQVYQWFQVLQAASSPTLDMLNFFTVRNLMQGISWCKISEGDWRSRSQKAATGVTGSRAHHHNHGRKQEGQGCHLQLRIALSQHLVESGNWDWLETLTSLSPAVSIRDRKKMASAPQPQSLVGHLIVRS